MDGQQEWNKVRSQISKNLNPLQPKDRFAINDVIMKKAENIMKKHLGKDSDFYDVYNIEPEFTLMSRKPGIARQYYDEHKDELFYQDFVSIPTKDGGKQIYPPPYYEKLFEEDFPENEVVERKEKRKQAKIDSVNLQLEKTDKNYLDYLKTKEYNLDSKIKTLVRSDC